jgi:hypothetical protein
MNKNKLTEIRNSIRNHAHELIIGTTVVVGIAAGFWLVKDAQKLDIGVAATKDMLKYMTETDNGILFQLEEGNFYLKKVDW